MKPKGKMILSFAVWLALSLPMILPVSASGSETVVGSLHRALTCFGTPSGTQFECDLGKAAADAVRRGSAADAAMLPGGILVKEIRGLGDVTRGDIEQAFDTDHEIVTAEISPRQLAEYLEAGVSHLVVGEDEFVDYARSEYAGFPQLSGVTVECDVSAPAGERIREIRTADGTALALDEEAPMITIALTREIADGMYGYPPLSAAAREEKTLVESFADGFSDIDLLSVSSPRIRLIGTNENTVVHTLSRTVVFLAVVLLAVPVVWAKRKSAGRKHDGGRWSRMV